LSENQANARELEERAWVEAELSHEVREEPAWNILELWRSETPLGEGLSGEALEKLVLRDLDAMRDKPEGETMASWAERFEMPYAYACALDTYLTL